MDKKDIYEHLAKIYLDASSNKKKKRKSYHKFFNKFYVIIAVFIFCIITVKLVFFIRNKPFNREIALVLLSEAAKINFNFAPAKKETFTLGMNNLNLKRFNSLGFSLKKKNYNDTIALRVEFSNSFKEKSEIYVKNIPYKWQDYKIKLSDFKNINDWSNISNLIFTVEEWNTREKEGIVYLDNIKLLR